MAKKKDAQRELTELERRFCMLYLESFNGAEAYQRASPRKISRATAASNAHRLLQRDDVAAFIKEKRDEAMAGAGVTLQETINKLRQALTYDPRKLFREDGSAKDINELDDDTVIGLAGFDVDEIFEYVGQGSAREKVLVGYTRKFKLLPRTAAIDLAMKYHGLFEKDNRQKTDPVTELINDIRARGSRIVPKA